MSKNNTIKTLSIWDLKDQPKNGFDEALLWQSYNTDGKNDVFSVPQLVEDNADHLRDSYLAWVYEFGQTKIRGRSIIEHLKLRPEVSYWWMTLFQEKSNYSKSPQIDNAIKLIAFNEWAIDRNFDLIILSTSNTPLKKCIELWCNSNSIKFEFQDVKKIPKHLSLLRRIYKTFPYYFQAHLWLLVNLIERWPLKSIGLKNWRNSKGRITFFSYSDNLIYDPLKKNHFDSLYWTKLPKTLKQESLNTNWLHIYVKDDVLPTTKHAAKMIGAFNEQENGLQCHVALDTFLSASVIFQTILDSFRLFRIGISLRRKIPTKFQSSLNLSPLFYNDWCKSLFGSTAMNNLLDLNLFEAALKNLPKQDQGIYLQENMSWEFSLIQTWRSLRHGNLIGTPHSTIRFWDLRYFFDRRNFQRNGDNDFPMPNQVACNGPEMLDFHIKSGYPLKNLIEVEALRYLYLLKDNLIKDSFQVLRNKPLKLLIFGDFLRNNTEVQMNLLVSALPLLPFKIDVTVKPHPNCPISPDDFPSLNIFVTMGSIDKLLVECDVAYSSSVTSAAVDALYSNVSIISVLDPTKLNLSPLRGNGDVAFISTPNELAKALKVSYKSQKVSFKSQEFFTLDNKLPRWQSLLLNKKNAEINK
jgi:surface carbohydrate biosynthesis protein (TIGR04326 family)